MSKSKSTIYWTTGKGFRISVRELENQHLLNIIIYVKKRVEEARTYLGSQVDINYFVVNGRPALEWIEILEGEWQRRKTTTIAEINAYVCDEDDDEDDDDGDYRGGLAFSNYYDY